GDVEVGFREAARTFEHTFRTQLAHQGYLEPHAGVVAIDENDRVQVWASNKMPFRLKELLSHALQLPAEKIRVNLTPIGGNLGGASMGAGVYRIPNLHIESFCVYTNNIPCGHARSPGEPQMVFAEESHMDMIAKELALDPADFRRRNLLRDGDHLANGHHLEHVRASDTLEAALKASEYSQPKPGLLVGRGMAMTHRHIGVGFTNAVVRLEADGRVTLRIALPDTGTGAHLVLRQVVAEVLGLAVDDVEIELATTDDFTTDSGVGGSRVTHTGGRAAFHAAEKLKAQIHAEAAKLGVPAASLAAVARAAARDGRTLDASHF